MDGRERERLRQFVRSPYFNRHEATSQLLDYLLRELGKARPKLEQERVAAALANAGSDQPLSGLQSGLMKLINRFLAIEQLREDRYAEEVFTLKRTEQLQRLPLLENRGKRFERKLSGDAYNDRHHHLAGYEWKAIKGYQITQEDRAHNLHFQEMLDHLDRYWIVEKLRHATKLTANMMLMNTHYEFFFLEELLAYLGGAAGQSLRASEKSIDCYYHMLLSLREPDDERHYAKMQEYLEEGEAGLPHGERKDLFEFSTNYCIKRIMSKHAKYRRELFDLYRRGLTTEIIFDRGELSEWNYKNIVTIGGGVGEMEWTERFIEDYRERLPPNRRNDAYGLNKAEFLYKAGRLDEAARELAGVNDSDVKYHQARVMLQVRIAYEQFDTDYALNLLETFRLYVTRNRNISQEDKRSYLNYVRFAKQLVNLKHQADYIGRAIYDRKLTALHENIKTTDLLVGRQWLTVESTPKQAATA